MTPVLKLKIRDAVCMIANSSLLLPAIQREFVWKKQAIELMFDSILRGYPINTLMFWKVDDISQQQLDFYSFLNPNYIFGVTRNVPFNKAACSGMQKLIVIDGQQRLTSIYIGLYGAYQTQKGKPMSLYLRLDAPATDTEKHYDFRFMSAGQFKSVSKQGGTWFKMNDLTSPNYNIFAKYPNLATSGNSFALDAMRKLDQLLDTDEYLHYYHINGYNLIDDVLEIFTRTNNSGTPLTKGDLLLSALTTSWTYIDNNANAREYVKDITDEVKSIGYKIDRDWVIKCCLVLFSSNIKMQVSNFSSAQVNGQSLPRIIYNNRDDLKQSIIEAFELVKRINLLEKGLTTKLAVIPIVQYIYKHQLWKTINKAKSGHYQSEPEIQKWLFRSIVRNLFEAGTDDILKNVKSIVDSKSTKTYFPYNEIESKYGQLIITQPVINELLSTPKISAFPILNIIFMKHIKQGTRYDMDHTHPEVQFRNLVNVQFTTPQDENRAKDGETYNSVRNLQLLTDSENRSKNKMTLSAWVKADHNPNALMVEHGIPQNVSLDIKDFNTYIDARSKKLEELLQANLDPKREESTL